MRIVVGLAGLTLAMAGVPGAIIAAEVAAPPQTMAPPPRTIAYGSGALQQIDYYAPPRGAEAPPLLLFVHGGGWRIGDKKMVAQKPAWAQAQGLAFASVGYGLLPDTPLEGQARDVAAAVKLLRAQAGRLGFDPDRIILMGHSAGAHLVALVATDPAYFGRDLSAVKAVIPLDGAGYDVPRQMAAGRFLTRRIYGPAFGTDVARQKQLSPVHHGALPNAPRWLIVHSSERADSGEQSRLLANTLRKAGATVAVQPVALTHREINVRLGTPGYPAQAAIDSLIAEVKLPK